MTRAKSTIKSIPRMLGTAAVDTALASAGWMLTQYGASLIPFTDTTSTEYFGLRPIDTLKRVGIAAVLGIAGSIGGLDKEHVRVLLVGSLLNTMLSVVESVLPTNLAGNLGLYPEGNALMAGDPNNFVKPGFFPALPGTVPGDGHGMDAYLNAYMH